MCTLGEGLRRARLKYQEFLNQTDDSDRNTSSNQLAPTLTWQRTDPNSKTAPIWHHYTNKTAKIELSLNCFSTRVSNNQQKRGCTDKRKTMPTYLNASFTTATATLSPSCNMTRTKEPNGGSCRIAT